MSEKINLCLLDNLNNIIGEIYIIKPRMLSELFDIITKNFKNLSENYNIFYLSENNNEIIINNDNEYKLSNEILFIREIIIENWKNRCLKIIIINYLNQNKSY